MMFLTDDAASIYVAAGLPTDFVTAKAFTVGPEETCKHSSRIVQRRRRDQWAKDGDAQGKRGDASLPAERVGEIQAYQH